jgi:hypothetical protein
MVKRPPVYYGEETIGILWWRDHRYIMVKSPSVYYGEETTGILWFWLPLWYLQALLTMPHFIQMSVSGQEI